MKLIGKVFAFFLRAAAFCLRNLWIPLSLLLTAQAGLLYVAVSEVRIPDRAVDELLMRLEKEGFSGKIGGLYLRNLTVVTAEDVRVDMLRGGDPLLKVRRLAVKLAPSALISGNWIPLFVYADGAELFCPAANSATGRSERLISSGSLISRRRSGEIELGGAEFELAGAKFAVFGKFPGTRRFFFGENGTGMPDFGGFSDIPVADGAKPLSARVGALAGTLSSALSRPELRQVLSSASITAQISPDGNEAMAVDVSALVRSIDFFEKARAEKISAEQRFSVRPSTAEVFPRGPLRVAAEALSFNAGDEFSEKIFGRAERLCAAAQIPEAAFSADAELSARLPKKVAARVGRLRAVSLTHGEAELRSVLFSVAPQKSWVIPDSFDLRLNAVAGTTALSCAGALSTQAGRPLLNLVYDAVLDKDELLAFPQLNFVANQEDMRVLRFAEPPRVRAKIVSGDAKSVTTTPRERSASLMPGDVRMPPPVATTAPASGSHSSTQRRSSARNAASPSSAKMSLIFRRTRFSISLSVSTKGRFRRRARRRPTEDFPVPMNPVRIRFGCVDGVSRSCFMAQNGNAFPPRTQAGTMSASIARAARENRAAFPRFPPRGKKRARSGFFRAQVDGAHPADADFLQSHAVDAPVHAPPRRAGMGSVRDELRRRTPNVGKQLPQRRGRALRRLDAVAG